MPSLILCYHATSESWSSDLSVRASILGEQVRRLLARGYVATGFTDAVLTPGPRRLAITFDDAFVSVYDHAAPVLAELGVPATVFAPTDYVDTVRPLAWPGTEQWLQGPDAGELTPMRWDQLGELADRGWEIGSHTRSHPRLTTLGASALTDELSGSRIVCEERLGRPCTSIAYPYGDVDERVAAAASAAGYRAGANLASTLAPNGALQAPRIGIYPADLGWRYRLKVSRPLRALRASSLWPG